MRQKLEMSEQITNYYFYLFKNSDKQEVEKLQKFKSINEILKQNDWLFISPIFFQGYELTFISKIESNEPNIKNKILKIVSKKFYDLRYTASFVEGYCARCNYIRPFSKSIENSIIYAFQKDYEGSIKTIIPIIEGIMRKYLITEKGFTTVTIRMKDLKNSFKLLKDDIISDYHENLKYYKSENNELLHFSELQIEELTLLKKEYYDIWFSFVDDFVNKSFYLNTNGQPLTNEVNRHSILHEFGLSFNYNLENYLKIYFLLQFMTWVFLRKENQTTLNEIENYRYFDKITAYERLIKLSENILYEKHKILQNYDDYDEAILKENFIKNKNYEIPKKHIIIHRILRKIDKLLWKNNVKKPYR